MAQVAASVNNIQYKHPSYSQLVPYPPGIPRPIPSLPFASYGTMRMVEEAKKSRNKSLAASLGYHDPYPADSRKPIGKHSGVSKDSLARVDSTSLRKTSLALIDVDSVGPVSDDPYYLVIPTIPRELEYQGIPVWATIASVGRNVPFYHYSGAEDTLSFTIDWYSQHESREDVIFACRWIEARSKADGYSKDPHRIKISWGSNDRLFQDSLWIVYKAPYKLSNFHRHFDMLPTQAFQEVTLKKVSDYNLKTPEIFGGFGPEFTPTTTSWLTAELSLPSLRK